MKAKHYRKLTKALELIEQAQNMVEELAAADPDFGHSANSTYRGSRIAAAVSILRTEVEQFAPQDDDAPNYNESWNTYQRVKEERARRDAWAMGS